MKWWDYEKDEREQWRKQEMTKAYLEELAEQEQSYTDHALSDLWAEATQSALVAAGRVDGVARATRIATEEQ